jgi:hypothetical protein
MFLVVFRPSKVLSLCWFWMGAALASAAEVDPWVGLSKKLASELPHYNMKGHHWGGVPMPLNMELRG